MNKWYKWLSCEAAPPAGRGQHSQARHCKFSLPPYAIVTVETGMPHEVCKIFCLPRYHATVIVLHSIAVCIREHRDTMACALTQMLKKPIMILLAKLRQMSDDKCYE